jgi:ABC-type sugar transport system permease subunit
MEQVVLETPKRKSLNSYKRSKFIWSLIFLSPWIIGFLTLFLIPFIRGLQYSFYTLDQNNGLVMTFNGIGNYLFALNEHVTGNTSFRVELINTTMDAVINIPVLLIFSLFIAVMLNMEFKGRAFVRAVFFIPVILNSAAVTSALSGGGELISSMLEEQGIGQVFDLEFYLVQSGVMPWLVTFIVGLIDRIYDILSLAGVPILLFLASIQSVPKHLYEAAKIEGATSYEMFWLITLPNVSPHIITVTIYALVDTFLTSSVSMIISDQFSKADNWGYAAAMSWIYVSTIILILLVLFVLAKMFNIGGSHYEE